MSSTIRNQAKLGLAALAAALLVLSAANPSWAQPKTGFDTETTKTQGNSGKTNDNANPDNEGQVTTTTTGPKGALKNDNTPDDQVDTTTSGPGKSNQ